MRPYKVDLLSAGGGYRHSLVVTATSPDRARQLAVTIANAKAQAQGKRIQFHATNVTGC